MALTTFQRDVCRLLADRRRQSGDSYVAGGVALSAALETARLSRDVDLFHDTAEAVATSWEADRRILEAHGYAVVPLRDVPGFAQATVSRRGDTLLIEWARDSAFRFFPLVEHEELGLTLHPFDLATNKVLALVGRLEVRDWVDVLACHERLQPLGYLAWAACGKDPGFSPPGVLDHARRTARYSVDEVATLAFEGETPDARALSRTWHHALDQADRLVRAMPADQVGTAVLGHDTTLFTGDIDALLASLAGGRIRFHRGRIGGALPRMAL